MKLITSDTIDRFRSVRVLCVGDVMLDRFVSGSVKRISPEAPVPVLLAAKDQPVAGGAANVARNVVALGGACTLVGLIGDDATGRLLVEGLGRETGIVPALVTDPGRPTTEKIRFSAGGQHMLRIDWEVARPASPAMEDALIATIAAALPGQHVVVLSDYAKGTLTDRVVAETIRLARGAGVPVVVDPKSSDFTRYAGATIITPNAKETAAVAGIEPSTDALAEAAGRAALAQAGSDAILVTRAEKGMTLVEASGVLHVASLAREVTDVVGAGDTVVATLALGLGVGRSLADAARIANAAAGIVVGKHGTATVTPAELLAEFAAHPLPPANGADKIVSWAEAKDLVAAWRREGHRVGFTNGCFDILHVGHVRIIDFSRAHCGRLILGLNSDASVKRLKGPTRPINSEADRALLLASLANVDAVVIYEDDTPQEIINHLLPDVLVKGADYTIAEIVGAETVLAHGGEVLRCELVPGRSTTGIIARGAAARDPA